jgi:Asp-tRNA(Asn)/Glu-tRNA(Gln) amidotransferase A subunit family amidase
MLIEAQPLAAIAEALRSGALDLHEYIDRVLSHIAVDEESVQSLLPEPGRRERLQAAADQLLAEYPNPPTRPLLFGVLVGVKDIFHVDGFTTYAGSTLPPEELAGEEAVVVSRLRTQGALILGTTVTTEFAYFEPGPTRNPHNLEYTPGGSSSGSAAAVAAGFAALAIGTQTIGSVIRPAAFCGIVGYKPSLHRIPSQGLVYFSPTIDHVGLFTQDAAGMRLAASALLNDWRDVSEILPRPSLAVPVGEYLLQTSAEGLEAFERHVAHLREAGIRIVAVAALEQVEELNMLHRRMVAAEFARQHRNLYPRFAERYRERTRDLIMLGESVDDVELEILRANILQLRIELEGRLDQAGVDAFICPSALGAAPVGIAATGDPVMNLPWTHAGLPSITLEAGFDESGMPLGVQLVARFGDDEELLHWSVALEGLLR